MDVEYIIEQYRQCTEFIENNTNCCNPYKINFCKGYIVNNNIKFYKKY